VNNVGTIYVADTGHGSIQKLVPTGTNWAVSTIATGFSGPVALTVDPTSTIYVSDWYDHTVSKVTPVGTNWVVKSVAGLRNSSGSTDGTNSIARFTSVCGPGRSSKSTCQTPLEPDGSKITFSCACPSNVRVTLAAPRADPRAGRVAVSRACVRRRRRSSSRVACHCAANPPLSVALVSTPRPAGSNPAFLRYLLILLS
jgi:hypothetical protein